MRNRRIRVVRLPVAYYHCMSSVSGNSRAQRKPDIRRLFALMFCVLLPAVTLARAEDQSIADIPFEQLLQTDIVTAEKIARQISDAPSAVSIVTADDIRTYGYRTLSDILDSMRGL